MDTYNSYLYLKNNLIEKIKDELSCESDPFLVDLDGMKLTELGTKINEMLCVFGKTITVSYYIENLTMKQEIKKSIDGILVTNNICLKILFTEIEISNFDNFIETMKTAYIAYKIYLMKNFKVIGGNNPQNMELFSLYGNDCMNKLHNWKYSIKKEKIYFDFIDDIDLDTYYKDKFDAFNRYLVSENIYLILHYKQRGEKFKNRKVAMDEYQNVSCKTIIETIKNHESIYYLSDNMICAPTQVIDQFVKSL